MCVLSVSYFVQAESSPGACRLVRMVMVCVHMDRLFPLVDTAAPLQGTCCHGPQLGGGGRHPTTPGDAVRTSDRTRGRVSHTRDAFLRRHALSAPPPPPRHLPPLLLRHGARPPPPPCPFRACPPGPLHTAGHPPPPPPHACRARSLLRAGRAVARALSPLTGAVPGRRPRRSGRPPHSVRAAAARGRGARREVLYSYPSPWFPSGTAFTVALRLLDAMWNGSLRRAPDDLPPPCFITQGAGSTSAPPSLCLSYSDPLFQYLCSIAFKLTSGSHQHRGTLFWNVGVPFAKGSLCTVPLHLCTTRTVLYCMFTPDLRVLL